MSENLILAVSHELWSVNHLYSVKFSLGFSNKIPGITVSPGFYHWSCLLGLGNAYTVDCTSDHINHYSGRLSHVLDSDFSLYYILF